MGTRNNKLWLAPLAIALFVVGCGDDDEAEPSGPVLTIDSGTPIIDSAVATSDATAGDAGVSTGECKGTNNCYSCKPTTNVQLLNACSTGCVPFDNSKRLPSYQPGKLPPL